jgi:two-component system, sensor histidine kinase and response regulator
MSDKHTILYVDDEQENLDAFYSVFRRDFHVLVTKDPLEAIKMLQAHVIKVIISDQRMPSMSGVEFLKTTLAENPKPTRILLTGYADMSAVVSAINEGRIFMYLTKPWSEEDLRSQLQKAIQQYEAGAEQQFLVLRLKEYNQLLEEKVSHRTKSLMETNTRLHSFMKIAAHDLKNPLTAIRSSAEILEHNGINMSSEKRAHHASGIVDSSDRMLDIITHILEDSRRHQGAFKPLMDVVNVLEVIHTAIRDNALLADQKHIKIVFEPDAQQGSVVIWADRLGIQQVLLNFHRPIPQLLCV